MMSKDGAGVFHCTLFHVSVWYLVYGIHCRCLMQLTNSRLTIVLIRCGSLRFSSYLLFRFRTNLASTLTTSSFCTQTVSLIKSLLFNYAIYLLNVSRNSKIWPEFKHFKKYFHQCLLNRWLLKVSIVGEDSSTLLWARFSCCSGWESLGPL